MISNENNLSDAELIQQLSQTKKDMKSLLARVKLHQVTKFSKELDETSRGFFENCLEMSKGNKNL
jgi:hypothetical protein